MIDNVLVICVGNICRSPMAEGLLRQALPRHTVSSAGLGALVGQPADPIAIELMQAAGVDITAHRARQLRGELMAETDLVLVMELEHQRHLEREYPLLCGKIFRLCEYSRTDVADPYQRGLPAFQEALQRITEGAGAWSKRILALDAPSHPKFLAVEGR